MKWKARHIWFSPLVKRIACHTMEELGNKKKKEGVITVILEQWEIWEEKSNFFLNFHQKGQLFSV